VSVEKAPDEFSGFAIKSAACARSILWHDEELSTTHEVDGMRDIWKLDTAHVRCHLFITPDQLDLSLF